MAITLMLYPKDPLDLTVLGDNPSAQDLAKIKYLDEPITFTFGEMTPEYYKKITSGSNNLQEHTDYGYYIDNVIGQGSNVVTTFLNEDTPPSAFGFVPSDFLTEVTQKSVRFYYKISDTLYLIVRQTISAYWGNTNNGKAKIDFSIELGFKSTYRTDGIYLSEPGTLINSNQLDLYCTYEEFNNINGALNPFGYVAKIGAFMGLNSYPSIRDLVENSITTTGCIIQSYTITPRPNNTPPYYMYQYGINTFGVNGTQVTPWHNTATEQFYVPEILGYGYELQFPPSAEDDIIGGYNNDSDEGDIPSLPEQSAVRSGMVRLYQMTTSQLNNFAKFLWNTSLTEWDSFMNTLKQWFNNPLDSIISLSISPIDMFYNYTTKIKTEPVATNIKLGSMDTGVQGYQCLNNYIQISLGEISLKPYYNSFLDCNPHTKFSLYLPYIGFKDVDADVIFSKRGTAIEVVYSVDVMTGVCVANVLIEKESNGTKLKHIIYTYAGNMNTTIPISSANMKDFISASVGAVASGVGMVASGGTITPVIMGSMLAQQGLNVASQKVNVSHSGGMSLESGMFGIQYAYLIVTRPREARPSNYQNINGIPSEIGGRLIEFSGFTQVSSVKVDIPNATDDEKNEIEKLLKEGIFI